MALTKAQIDLRYHEVLARHATEAEQVQFAALSATESTAQIDLDIATLPEATQFVDPVIRLYQGAFGRLPDTVDPDGSNLAAYENGDITNQLGHVSGFEANVDALRSGISLLALAQAFVASAEFAGIYGSTAVTPALITAYYQHILQRDPSSAEVAAWQATGLNAAQILIGFTQSAEFITKSQQAVNDFKVALAEGLHPSGPLPIAPLTTVEADVNAVDEGSPVTFTIQGQVSDAGKTYAYTIKGVSPEDIVGGQLSGSVTLDSQGVAFLTINLVADATTEGNELLTLNVAGIDTTVTVNDTSKTPVNHDFTAKVGETLDGSDASDVFTGIVDKTFVNDQTTLSNIIDVANGGGGIDTEKVFVFNNFFGTQITPTSSSVEIFQATDLAFGGSTFNMQFSPDVLEIDEVNSAFSSTFNNVQKLVSIGLISPTGNGVDMTVNLADTVANGDVGVTLVNAGPGGNAVDITYRHNNGSDAATGYVFNVTGQNQNVDLNNTTPTTFINVVGADATGLLDLDLQDGTNGLLALTSIDASNFAGALTMDDIGQASALVNNLDVKGSQGNNIIAVTDANNAKVTVTTQGGQDNITVTNQGTGKVTVNSGNGNGDAVVVQAGAGPSGDVDVTVGNGNGDTVNITTANNAGPGLAKVTVNMGSGTSDTAIVNLGTFHSLELTATGNHARIAADANAANTPTSIKANGGDASISVVQGANSGITVEATGIGGNFTTKGDDGIFTSGLNPLGIDYNQSFRLDALGANSPVSLTTGDGADIAFVAMNVAKNGATVNNLTVSLAGGNDSLILWDDKALHTGVSLDGGLGTDNLSLTSLAAQGGTNGATVTGFESLEFNTTLGGGVVVSDFASGNHVILDAGFTTGSNLVGVNSGVEIDLFGASAGQVLGVSVTGANIHTNDVVNIDLHNAANAAQNFGNVFVQDVEAVSITSEGVGSAANTVALTNIGQAITTLNIDGDNALVLNKGTFFFATDFLSVKTVDASNHSGGLTLNLNSTFGTNNQDATITLGSGADTFTTGNGDNHIDAGQGGDTINVGTGANSIIGGAGADTINLGAGAVASTLVYKAVTESGSGGTVDTVNGFNGALDKIDLSALGITSFNFAGNVAGAGAAAATIAGDPNGVTTAVFDDTNDILYIDMNGDHVLTAADMQVNLVGTNVLSNGTFII